VGDAVETTKRSLRNDVLHAGFEFTHKIGLDADYGLKLPFSIFRPYSYDPIRVWEGKYTA
jgi:hypothetical protein